MKQSQKRAIATRYTKAKEAYTQATRELDEYVDLYMDLYFDYENDVTVMDALNTLCDNKANNLQVAIKRTEMIEAENAVLEAGKLIVREMSGDAILNKVLPAFETNNLTFRWKTVDATMQLLTA